MNRREFILSAGAAALAVGASRPGYAESPGGASRSAPRLAFQVYGVRDLCDGDLAGTLKAAKAMGYDGVETGRLYGRSAAEWKAMCADVGLELVALQLYPFNLTEPDLAKTIRFCHKSGCTHVSTAWFKGSAENLGDWQLAVNVINHAAEVCAREGITVAYHNHDQEFAVRFGGRPVWEWLFEGEGRNPELAQVFPLSRFSSRVLQEFDANWCAVAGEDPVAWFRRSAARNPTIHVTVEDPRCDWPELVRIAKGAGTRWLVVKPTRDPKTLDLIRKDHAYLKGLIETGGV